MPESILKGKTGTLVLYQPTQGVYNDTHSSMLTGTNIKNGLSGPTGTDPFSTGADSSQPTGSSGDSGSGAIPNIGARGLRGGYVVA